ncbi:hypothetical protein JMJ77_0007289 [Colletotrichum scovillei]|uniref:Uncharacterized protein n=1 Tax=Colletotrichum scovillei TaxID=1209932 RepID=A0A9P7RCS1_9PEZI|nr:hypothetical protein JMJ77_0007289 [Colletotrichum scovillei]KAG7074223.1 hypothetical protein JMJ76_0010707 [Colletotrichum scovillei]KAG7081312.1 hypothetical protein JMJ78_0003436 [Colletotrichum scovillei]
MSYLLLLIDSQFPVPMQLQGDSSTKAGGLMPCTNLAMETDCIGATSAVRIPWAGRRMETQSNMPSRLRSIGTAGMARDTDTDTLWSVGPPKFPTDYGRPARQLFNGHRP